jgi:hypothetical protein
MPLRVAGCVHAVQSQALRRWRAGVGFSRVFRQRAKASLFESRRGIHTVSSQRGGAGRCRGICSAPAVHARIADVCVVRGRKVRGAATFCPTVPIVLVRAPVCEFRRCCGAVMQSSHRTVMSICLTKSIPMREFNSRWRPPYGLPLLLPGVCCLVPERRGGSHESGSIQRGEPVQQAYGL